MFRDTKDANVRTNLLKILCLVTCPEYPDFYAEAYKLLDDSTATSLPYELGILLGDCKAKEQQDTLTDYLKAALYAVKFRPLLAFEYVLAVLRLRSRDEEELEGRYNSRISFDDKTASLAREKHIPVFLYALLSYITGEKGENEIKITEIKEEE